MSNKPEHTTISSINTENDMDNNSTYSKQLRFMNEQLTLNFNLSSYNSTMTPEQMEKYKKALNDSKNKELYNYFMKKFQKVDVITKSIRSQINNEDSDEDQMSVLEKIRSLENWDKQNIRVNHDEYNKFKKDKEISNLYGEIKKDLMNLKGYNLPVLKEFSKKVDYEKESIMLQNIKMTKRKFKFDVFLKTHKSKSKSKKKNIDKYLMLGKVRNRSRGKEVKTKTIFNFESGSGDFGEIKEENNYLDSNSNSNNYNYLSNSNTHTTLNTLNSHTNSNTAKSILKKESHLTNSPYSKIKKLNHINFNNIINEQEEEHSDEMNSSRLSNIELILGKLEEETEENKHFLLNPYNKRKKVNIAEKNKGVSYYSYNNNEQTDVIVDNIDDSNVFRATNKHLNEKKVSFILGDKAEDLIQSYNSNNNILVLNNQANNSLYSPFKSPPSKKNITRHTSRKISTVSNNQSNNNFNTINSNGSIYSNTSNLRKPSKKVSLYNNKLISTNDIKESINNNDSLNNSETQEVDIDSALVNEAKTIEDLYNKLASEDVDVVAKLERYREIIREKIKNEKKHRDDLLRISKLIIECEKTASYKQKEISEYMKIHNDILKQIREEASSINRRLYIINQKIQKINLFISNQENIVKTDKSMSSTSILKNYRKDKDELQKEENFLLEENKRIELKKEKKLKEILKKINEKKNELNNQESGISLNRAMLNEMMAEQRLYYMDILSKGIDSRTNGLVWVVKKLIELKTIFSPNMFPKFLNKLDIEYLLELGFKEVEIYKLQIILHYYKEKLKLVKNEFNDKNKHNDPYVKDNSNSKLLLEIDIKKKRKIMDTIKNNYNLVTKNKGFAFDIKSNITNSNSNYTNNDLNNLNNLNNNDKEVNYDDFGYEEGDLDIGGFRRHNNSSYFDKKAVRKNIMTMYNVSNSKSNKIVSDNHKKLNTDASDISNTNDLRKSYNSNINSKNNINVLRNNSISNNSASNNNDSFNRKPSKTNTTSNFYNSAVVKKRVKSRIEGLGNSNEFSEIDSMDKNDISNDVNNANDINNVHIISIDRLINGETNNRNINNNNSDNNRALDSNISKPKVSFNTISTSNSKLPLAINNRNSNNNPLLSNKHNDQPIKINAYIKDRNNIIMEELDESKIQTNNLNNKLNMNNSNNNNSTINNSKIKTILSNHSITESDNSLVINKRYNSVIVPPSFEIKNKDISNNREKANNITNIKLTKSKFQTSTISNQRNIRLNDHNNEISNNNDSKRSNKNGKSTINSIDNLTINKSNGIKDDDFFNNSNSNKEDNGMPVLNDNRKINALLKSNLKLHSIKNTPTNTNANNNAYNNNNNSSNSNIKINYNNPLLNTNTNASTYLNTNNSTINYETTNQTPINNSKSTKNANNRFNLFSNKENNHINLQNNITEDVVAQNNEKFNRKRIETHTKSSNTVSKKDHKSKKTLKSKSILKNSRNTINKDEEDFSDSSDYIESEKNVNQLIKEQEKKLKNNLMASTNTNIHLISYNSSNRNYNNNNMNSKYTTNSNNNANKAYNDIYHNTKNDTKSIPSFLIAKTTNNKNKKINLTLQIKKEEEEAEKITKELLKFIKKIKPINAEEHFFTIQSSNNNNDILYNAYHLPDPKKPVSNSNRKILNLSSTTKVSSKLNSKVLTISFENAEEVFNRVFLKDDFLEYLNSSNDLKKILDEIMKIRNTLNDLYEYVELLKNKKQSDFAKTYEIKNYFYNNELKIQHDIISSCLFGNSIAI